MTAKKKPSDWFITFEGIEGSGKTTQLKKLAVELERCKISHVVTREPGGTELAEAVRKLLLDDEVGEIVPLSEFLLFSAARVDHIRRIIMPALQEGKVVLCDRFTDASTAYQGFGGGLMTNFVESLNQYVSSDCIPDLTLLLDVDVGTSMDRLNNRQERHKDRMEKLDRDFHTRVRHGYLKIAESHPDRFVVIDGSDNADTVFQHVLKAVQQQTDVVIK